MSTYSVPRRIRALDAHYADRGGIAAYAVGKVDSGMRMGHLASELTNAIGETVPVFTLYQWIRRWRAELAGKEMAEA